MTTPNSMSQSKHDWSSPEIDNAFSSSSSSSSFHQLEPLNSSPPNTAADDQQQKIIEVIQNSPNYTITPARLSSSLGISVEDAGAELCGLLRVVGPTASFRFESISVVGSGSNNTDVGGGGKEDSLAVPLGRGQVMTMVFQFPPDFAEKAYSAERKEGIKQILCNIAYITWKIFKVVIAFGLILSLIILILGGLCAMVAAIVIMARGGSGGGGQGHRQHHQRLVSQMRSMLLTLRQLLWFYVIFGDGLDQMQDSFLRETAHTLALGLNLLLGSPRSIWFWWNAQRFRNRHNRQGLGLGRCISYCNRMCWGGMRESTFWRDSWRRGTEDEIRRESTTTSTTSMSSMASLGEGSQRSSVSIAAEFLFGPTPFWPRPTVMERWKLRENFIVMKSIESGGKGAHLMQFLPFTDDPPCIKIREDSDDIDQDRMMKVLTSSWDARLRCLHIVSHFNGVPVGTSTSGNNFVFPELMAEKDSTTFHFPMASMDEEDDTSWRSFFHASEDESLCKMSGYYPKHKDRMKVTDDVPEYMHECRHVLTRLSGPQFAQCIILNILNYIGIIMLRMSISKGGALEVKSVALLSVLNAILSILELYARFFFAVPISRGLILTVLNYRLSQRNHRRKEYAQWMKAKKI